MNNKTEVSEQNVTIIPVIKGKNHNFIPCPVQFKGDMAIITLEQCYLNDLEIVLRD